jgi:hypothetical protein
VSKYAPYVQRKAYLFHRVFGETTQQRQLYRQAIAPVVFKVRLLASVLCALELWSCVNARATLPLPL